MAYLSDLIQSKFAELVLYQDRSFQLRDFND